MFQIGAGKSGQQWLSLSRTKFILCAAVMLFGPSSFVRAAQLYVFTAGAGTYTSGAIGVFDASTGSVIDSSRVTGLRGNAFNDFDVHNGRIYVTLPLDGINSAIGVFNAATGALINPSLNAPAGPMAPGIDATDNAIFFTGGDFVTKIDSLTGSVISGFHGPTLGSTQFNIFWNVAAYDNRLYVGIRGQGGSPGSLKVYSATDGHLLSTISSASFGLIALSEDGNYLYNTNGNTGKVELFNALTGALINSSLASSVGATDIAVSDGDLYIARYDGTVGSICKYDALTGSAINASLLSGLSRPISIAVVPEVSSFCCIFGTLVLGSLIVQRQCFRQSHKC